MSNNSQISIEAEWLIFRKTALRNVPDEHLPAMRRIFYCGAAAFMVLTDNVSEIEDEAEAVRTIGQLHKEVLAFAASLRSN